MIEQERLVEVRSGLESSSPPQEQAGEYVGTLLLEWAIFYYVSYSDISLLLLTISNSLPLDQILLMEKAIVTILQPFLSAQ